MAAITEKTEFVNISVNLLLKLSKPVFFRTKHQNKANLEVILGLLTKIVHKAMH